MELSIVDFGSLPKLERFYSGSFPLNSSSLKGHKSFPCFKRWHKWSNHATEWWGSL